MKRKYNNPMREKVRRKAYNLRLRSKAPQHGFNLVPPSERSRDGLKSEWIYRDEAAFMPEESQKTILWWHKKQSITTGHEGDEG